MVTGCWVPQRWSVCKRFYTEVSGTRELYTTADIEGQLRGLMLQNISDAVAQSGIPFLDLAANQMEFAKAVQEANQGAFEALGLKLESVTVQNVSLPEELQKLLYIEDKALNQAVSLGLDRPIRFETPLMWLDKAETWALADHYGHLDTVRHQTLTCYNGVQGDGCGACPACELRRRGLDRYLADKSGIRARLYEKSGLGEKSGS
jgi:hypothetical protein